MIIHNLLNIGNLCVFQYDWNFISQFWLVPVFRIFLFVFPVLTCFERNKQWCDYFWELRWAIKYQFFQSRRKLQFWRYGEKWRVVWAKLSCKNLNMDIWKIWGRTRYSCTILSYDFWRETFFFILSYDVFFSNLMFIFPLFGKIL